MKCLAVNQEGFVASKRQFSKLKNAKDSLRHRSRETLQQAGNHWHLLDNFPRQYVSTCCQAVMWMTWTFHMVFPVFKLTMICYTSGDVTVKSLIDEES